MVAKAEQNHFAIRKRFRLKYRVTVALLFALHGESDALGKFFHLRRLVQQRGIFFKSLQIIGIWSAQIIFHGRVLAGLDDNANFFNARRIEFQQMIMKQRPRDTVRPHHGEQFLLHRVRRRKMPGAESGDGDDGFANVHRK